MQPALAYLRFSPRPDASESQSLEIQEHYVSEYCQRSGLEIVSSIRDPEESGGKLLSRRPGGAELIAKLSQAKIKHIVAYKLDRLFRNTRDGLRYFDEWGKRKITVHAADSGPLRTDKASDWMTVAMRLMVSEFERRQTSERTKDRHLHKQSNGWLVGSRPPYGTQLGKEVEVIVRGKKARRWTLIPNHAEQAVIARITHLHAEGCSDREIASALARDGVRGRSGLISHQLVGKILSRLG